MARVTISKKGKRDLHTLRDKNVNIKNREKRRISVARLRPKQSVENLFPLNSKDRKRERKLIIKDSLRNTPPFGDNQKDSLRQKNCNSRLAAYSIPKQSEAILKGLSEENAVISRSIPQGVKEKTELLSKVEKEADLEDGPIIPLTKDNLRYLQKNIFEKEIERERCPHFLCSIENMKSIDFSRLWFLFELEMTTNGDINLRNDCYHNKVYKQLDKKWIQSNCFLEKPPRGVTVSSLSHLLIPKLPKFEFVCKNTEKNLSEITVDIETIIENSEEIAVKPDKMSQAKKGRRRIPQRYRHNRNMENIFSNFSINVNKILNEKSRESSFEDLPIAKAESLNNKTKNVDRRGKLSYFNS